MKIIGIGEVVWDCFPEGKRLGGAPINFCFFAKELGAESYPVTAIGEDELGDETFTVLKETGLDLGYISRNILPVLCAERLKTILRPWHCPAETAYSNVSTATQDPAQC